MSFHHQNRDNNVEENVHNDDNSTRQNHEEENSTSHENREIDASVNETLAKYEDRLILITKSLNEEKGEDKPCNVGETKNAAFNANLPGQVNYNDIRNGSDLAGANMANCNNMQHRCYECGQTFGHQGLLARHITTHEKPFGCNLCGRRYIREDNLKRHYFNVHMYQII